jgi:hypothetical protein
MTHEARYFILRYFYITIKVGNPRAKRLLIFRYFYISLSIIVFNSNNLNFVASIRFLTILLLIIFINSSSHPKSSRVKANRNVNPLMDG